MAKQKLEMVEVTLYQYLPPDPEGTMEFTAYKRSEEYLYGAILLGEIKVRVMPLPKPTPQKVVEMQVETLRTELQKVKADNFLKEKRIEEKIQKLLCLEHKESK